MAIELVGQKRARAIGDNNAIPLDDISSIVFLGVSKNSYAGTNPTYTHTLPTFLQEGDFVILVHALGHIGDPDMSLSGWTLVADQRANDTYDCNLGTLYKVMGATPDTTVTLPATGAASYGAASLAYCFRGVDPTTPLDGVTPTVAQGSNSGTPNPPTITPATARSTLVIVGGGGSNAGLGNAAARVSDDYEGEHNSRMGATSGIQVAVGHKPDHLSGALDPPAFTFWPSSTTDSWAAVHMVLRAAAYNIVAENDLVVVSYADPGTSNHSEVVTVPSGWTTIADLYANDTRDTNLGTAYKIMGATPDSNIQVRGLASMPVAVAVAVLRGVDTTTPIDATHGVATGINGGIPDPPSVTPVTEGAVVYIARAASTGSLAMFNGVLSTGYFYRHGWDYNAASELIAVWAGIKPWVSGAENPDALATGWNTGTPYSWCAVTIPLRPAAGGSPQALTLGAFNAAPTLYAPTLTVDPLITLGAFDVAPTLYAPTIIIDQAVTLDVFDASPTLLAPTIIGEQAVTLGLFDGSPTLYAPIVTIAQAITLGAFDASPTLIAPTVIGDRLVSLTTFYVSPTLYAPALSVEPLIVLGLFDASPTFHLPTIGNTQFVTLGAFDGSPTLYAPTVALGAGTQTLVLGLFDGSPVLYAPSVNVDQLVTLGLFNAAPTLLVPDVVNSTLITLALFDAAPTFHAPAIVLGAPPQALTLVTFDASPTLHAPSIAVSQMLTLGLFDAAPTLYAPTIALAVTLDLFDAAPTLYAPTLYWDQDVTLPLTVITVQLFAPFISDRPRKEFTTSLDTLLGIQRNVPGAEDRQGILAEQWLNHVELIARLEHATGTRDASGRETHESDWVAYVTGAPDVRLADRAVWASGPEPTLTAGQLLEIVAIAPRVNERTGQTHFTALFLRRMA